MNGGSMLGMQLRVEQRIFWRNRSGMFFTFVLPLAMLFVLAMSDDPVDNVPLIAGLGILSTGFQGLAIQLAMHRDQGVLKRVMATPLDAGTLILGKALSTLLVIAVEVAIIVVAGVFIFGADAPQHPLTLVGFVVLGTACFVSLGFAVASLIPTSESAPAITNAAYLGLVLVTALLHNVDGLPDWVIDAGKVLPLENLVIPIQHAWTGGLDRGDAIGAVVLTAWAVVACAYSVRSFRWEPAGER
ncbi:MAG: type transporter [Thermoleophilia bacterium]|nr:type transporter [Thermoleophilia bacterium]